MDNLIFLIGVTAMLAVNSLVAYLLGWILTEVITLPLNFRPFNCRPCLTFWATFLINAAAAWVISPLFVHRALVLDPIAVVYAITGIGALLGLINFLYIKLKFQIV